MESALVLHAPNYRGIWPAWHDGEAFWVQPQPFMELLNYEVLVSDSTELVVRDQRHSITFDYRSDRILVNQEERVTGKYTLDGTAGEKLVSVDALQEAFGSELVWDREGLTLTLSSAATLFDASQFGDRRVLDMDPPPDILFPHARALLGGLHIGYTLRHEWDAQRGRSFSPSARISTHLVGGTVRADVGHRHHTLSYTYEVDTPWITKIEALRRPDGVGIQISNTPLLPRRVHREELRRGTTIPHAIVRGSVSGAVSEQVQADQEGRYAIRHPVFYGSTETTIEATPLGSDPIEVDATHWRVPYGILPSGEVEYSAYISPSPSVALGWGLNAKLTLQASASQSLQNTTLRLYTLPFPTVNLNSEVNLHDRSIRGDAYWWEPWGNMSASVQLNQKPASSQLYSMHAALASKIGNIHLGVTHRQTQDKPAQTTIRSTLGWQVAQPLRVDAGIQVHTGRSKPLSVQPRVTYTLPFDAPRIHIQASTTQGQESQSWEVGGLVSSTRWTSGIQVNRSPQTGPLAIRGSFQLNTDWAWFNTRAGWQDGSFFHSQSLRGTVLIGKDIRFGALLEERTQAVIRLFLDTNLNGEKDVNESYSIGHRISIPRAAHAHRADGEVVITNLTPFDVYTASILPASIQNPLLHPSTGYQFSFVPSPGRTRYMDIPLQTLPAVAGRLTDWPGSATILQVQLYRSGFQEDLDVYQDGVFVTQVPPGTYQTKIVNLLTKEVVMETSLQVEHGMNEPVISLGGGADE